MESMIHLWRGEQGDEILERGPQDGEGFFFSCQPEMAQSGQGTGNKRGLGQEGIRPERPQRGILSSKPINSKGENATLRQKKRLPQRRGPEIAVGTTSTNDTRGPLKGKEYLGERAGDNTSFQSFELTENECLLSQTKLS